MVIGIPKLITDTADCRRSMQRISRPCPLVQPSTAEARRLLSSKLTPCTTLGLSKHDSIPLFPLTHLGEQDERNYRREREASAPKTS